jgi:hypothetical protein
MRGGSRVFRLDHYFRFESEYGAITVPTGFLTDGASIPRIFWSILSPFGQYFPAAIIHDFLYSSSNDEFTRGESDEIFLDAMDEIGVGFLTRYTIYTAVRIGGRSSYKAQIS